MSHYSFFGLASHASFSNISLGHMHTIRQSRRGLLTVAWRNEAAMDTAITPNIFSILFSSQSFY